MPLGFLVLKVCMSFLPSCKSFPRFLKHMKLPIGDLLELKRSYSMTVDHQMGEIERLSEQLEQTERQLRSRKSEFESLSLRSQAKVDSLQQQVDELTAQLGAVTANSDAKGKD